MLFYEKKTIFDHNKAVSLIELAISLTIIAFIIAAVLTGRSMVASAEIRRLANEITLYDQAISNFYEEYQFYPGDFPEASVFWPECSPNCNGNGNERIEFDGAIEDLLLWRHLELSRFITGSYSGEIAASPVGSEPEIRYAPDRNLPESQSFTGGYFMVRSEASDLNGAPIVRNAGIALHFGSLVNGEVMGGHLTSTQASSLDRKLDDGLPALGRLHASIGVEGGVGCGETLLIGPGLGSGYQYDLDDDSPSCHIIFWHDVPTK